MVNKKTMETLFLDRLMGEMQVEVEALLEAYLAEHPEFENLEENLEKTVEVVKTALKPKEVDKLPSFAAHKMRSARQKNIWNNYRRMGVLLAGCLVVGMSFGLTQFGLENWLSTDVDSEELTQQLDVRSNVYADYDYSGPISAREFWSVGKFIERARTERYEVVDGGRMLKIIEAAKLFQRRNKQ